MATVDGKREDTMLTYDWDADKPVDQNFENEKIQEEELVLTPTEVIVPPIKKGFLVKQGHVVKNWKNRFFVLQEGLLCYYESELVNPPYGVHKKGEISLLGARLEVNKNFLSIICKDPKSGKEILGLLLDVRYPNERAEWSDAISQHLLYLNSKHLS
jgi:hypothetical protein